MNSHAKASRIKLLIALLAILLSAACGKDSVVSNNSGQQNAATSEISHKVVGAASSTKEVVSVLNRVAGAVDENRSAAETVLKAARKTGPGRVCR